MELLKHKQIYEYKLEVVLWKRKITFLRDFEIIFRPGNQIYILNTTTEKPSKILFHKSQSRDRKEEIRRLYPSAVELWKIIKVTIMALSLEALGILPKTFWYNFKKED